MKENRVTIQVLDNGIADVRLNRPDKLNALDMAMFDAIGATIDTLSALENLRAVVISGEGRGFCAGLDLNDKMVEQGISDLLPRHSGPANLFQHAAWGWRTLPVPVIAAVHGMALGGGFQIMLGADIRLVQPEAKLSLMEMRWGLVPDMAGIPLLRQLVRDDVARELIYSARTFDGREAKTLGLATRLDFDPRAAALLLANAIASASPSAIRAAKRLLNATAESDPAMLLRESEEQQALLRTPEHIAAKQQFLRRD